VPLHLISCHRKIDQLPLSKTLERSRASAWVSHMLSHKPEEIYRVLRYGTPSDELIKLSQRKIFMHVDKDDIRGVRFPESLNKSKGQKLLYKTAQDVIEFKKRIPLGMFYAYNEAKFMIKHRRQDTTQNILMVAEAIFSRAAAEFKVEVLFSFDSINAWITEKYGKILGYQTIRKALEYLEEKAFITVREWGQKNVRYKATKIYVNLDSTWRRGEISEADEWILYNSAAMNAVYSRESTARQDVLAANFQKFLAEQEETKRKIDAEEPIHVIHRRRTLAMNATIGAVKTEEKVYFNGIEMQEVWDDEFIDRLLGSLVQPVQEDVSNYRQSSPAIRGLAASQGGCRSS
jgi:hypothetical protein